MSSKELENVVLRFISRVSERFGVQKDELLTLWHNPQSVEVQVEEHSRADLERLTRSKLAELARERGLKTSGKKGDLVERLLSTDEPKITKNIFGLYEHKSTGLVFNDDGHAIGKQGREGQVLPLSKDDIQTCVKHSFKYVMPTKLATDTVDEDTADEDSDESSLDEDTSESEEDEEEV